MTFVATAFSARTSRAAGEELARQLMEQLSGTSPDAVIVFASAQNDYAALLAALSKDCAPKALIGCSSAGEFTDDDSGTGTASAIAISAADMRFRAALGRGLSRDSDAVADQLLREFQGVSSNAYRYRTAILLVDALAGHTESLLDRLTRETAGSYQFVGGGAGDDGRFQQTHVFYGTEAYSDAAVALEILSNKPIGIGAQHGWQPASPPMRVTESSDACVISLNVAPAVEAFEEYAVSTEQRFDLDDPMPFFLHNVVGVKTQEGHKLRVPLGIAADGGVVCAAEVPTGATAHIMSTGGESAADAALRATRDAVAQVERSGHKPRAALFFDCVATRLRLGHAFGRELEVVGRGLAGAPFVGFNSYGQIVRADGQFSGFHNCTAVVAVFPD